jgi:hypothetical protein
LCFHITIEKYKRQVHLSSKYLLDLPSFFLIIPLRIHFVAVIFSIWYLIWSLFYFVFCGILIIVFCCLKYGLVDGWCLPVCTYIPSPIFIWCSRDKFVLITFHIAIN